MERISKKKSIKKIDDKKQDHNLQKKTKAKTRKNNLEDNAVLIETEPSKVKNTEQNIPKIKKTSHFDDNVKHAPVSAPKKISVTPSLNKGTPKSPRQIKKSPLNRSPKEQNRILEEGGYKISNRTPNRRNVLGNLVFLFGRGGLLKTLDSYSGKYPEYSNRFNEDKQWVKDNFKKQ